MVSKKTTQPITLNRETSTSNFDSDMAIWIYLNIFTLLACLVNLVFGVLIGTVSYIWRILLVITSILEYMTTSNYYKRMSESKRAAFVIAVTKLCDLVLTSQFFWYYCQSYYIVFGLLIHYIRMPATSLRLEYRPESSEDSASD